MADQISERFGRKPWISLAYDGFADKVNPERVADLAEQLRHKARAALAAGAPQSSEPARAQGRTG